MILGLIRRILRVCLLASCLGILTACADPAAGLVDPVLTATRVSSLPVALPTATAVPLPSETVRIPTDTPPAATAALPEPTETLVPDLFAVIQQKIPCGETVCQIPWMGVLNRPISPEDQDRIDFSYPYGSTQNGTLDPHHGVEFINPVGTFVLAAAAGEVVYAGDDALTVLGPYTGFYGNLVIIQHPGLLTSLGSNRPVFTLYAHLSRLMVEEGQQVAAGQKIGEVGSSGAADGPHLHFEVRVDQNQYDHTTNPVLWLKPKSLPDGRLESVLTGLILDRTGQPLSRFDFSLEKLAADGTVEKKYYPQTYYPVGLNGFPGLGENFAAVDLSPGDYRLAFVAGTLHEVFFRLDPGFLVYFKVRVD